MYVSMICKDRNEKEKNELYQVLGLLAQREQVQIEDRGDVVEMIVCHKVRSLFLKMERI